MSESRGCGASVLLTGLLAEHPDHAAQLLEGLARRRAQELGGLPHLGRRQVGPDLQGSRVQRHQGDPVGEHVVHLARDAGTFRHPRRVLVQALVRLGPERALPKGQQQLAARPHEHPPRDGGQRERRGDQDHRDRVGGRAVDGEDHGARDPQGEGDQHRADRPVHGEGEQRQQAGGGRRHRDGPQQHARDRHAERPAPPPPQSEAGQSPAADVDDHLGGRQRSRGVAQGRAQEDRAQTGRGQAAGHVDEPFAPVRRPDHHPPQPDMTPP